MRLFGTNSKLQHTPDESRRFVAAIAHALREAPIRMPCQLWYAPPFTSIPVVADVCHAAQITLGAQDCHWDDEGQGTGGMSARVLRSAGAGFVMLGHVERRHHFGDTDAIVNRKLRAAERNGLGMMLCVGETADDKRAGVGPDRLRAQLGLALAGCERPGQLTVLYEPVWSVGAGGTPATPDAADVAFAVLRQALQQHFGPAGSAVPLLYGGSVDVTNCAGYATLARCDGLGVGRNAWTAESFLNVLRAAYDRPASHERESATVRV
jgi:L-erythrulose 1-phosphate isomerase